MALKQLKTNKYIIMQIDGTYIIYLDEKNRKAVKKATPHYKVIQKYNEIINQLLNDKEKFYYDPNFHTELENWIKEKDSFCDAYMNQANSKTFPLIRQYIKDAGKAIPKILHTGKIGFRGTKIETVEDAYNYVKQLKIFGETEDI